MIDDQRRNILRGTPAIFSMTVLSGCGRLLSVADDSPSERTLWLEPGDLEQSDEGYVIHAEVNVFLRGDKFAEAEDRGFHDVTVLGYAANGELICSKSIGDIPTEPTKEATRTIELQCRDVPKLVTFKAAESPCETDTTIHLMVRVDEKPIWDTGSYFRNLVVSYRRRYRHLAVSDTYPLTSSDWPSTMKTIRVRHRNESSEQLQ